MMHSANFLTKAFVFFTLAGLMSITSGILLFPGEAGAIVRDLLDRPYEFTAILPNSFQALVLTAGVSLHLAGMVALSVNLLLKLASLMAKPFSGSRVQDDSEENWIFI